MGKMSHGNVKHGHAVNYQYSPTYYSWLSMLARCRYVERDIHKKHIGRGITVDPRWLNFSSFLEDMGERPPGTTLDRKDNNGNYTKNNCQWATPTEQARNRRNSKMNYDNAYKVCMYMLNGYTAKQIANLFNCSISLPREIYKERCWKDASVAAKLDWNRWNG